MACDRLLHRMPGRVDDMQINWKINLYLPGKLIWPFLLPSDIHGWGLNTELGVDPRRDQGCRVQWERGRLHWRGFGPDSGVGRGDSGDGAEPAHCCAGHHC